MKLIFFTSAVLCVCSVYARPAAPLRRAAGSLDLGSCPNAAIAFGVGFEGRKEASFEPDDQTTFKHGSAQSIQPVPFDPMDFNL